MVCLSRVSKKECPEYPHLNLFDAFDAKSSEHNLSQRIVHLPELSFVGGFHDLKTVAWFLQRLAESKKSHHSRRFDWTLKQIIYFPHETTKGCSKQIRPKGSNSNKHFIFHELYFTNLGKKHKNRRNNHHFLIKPTFGVFISLVGIS